MSTVLPRDQRCGSPEVQCTRPWSPVLSESACRTPADTCILYARVGQGHCPQCGRPITAQTREQIIARILALPEGTRFLVLAPVVRGQKGEYKDLFEDMLKRGFVRARADGKVVRRHLEQRPGVRRGNARGAGVAPTQASRPGE